MAAAANLGASLKRGNHKLKKFRNHLDGNSTKLAAARNTSDERQFARNDVQRMPEQAPHKTVRPQQLQQSNSHHQDEVAALQKPAGIQVGTTTNTTSSAASSANSATTEALPTTATTATTTTAAAAAPSTSTKAGGNNSLVDFAEANDYSYISSGDLQQLLSDSDWLAADSGSNGSLLDAAAITWTPPTTMAASYGGGIGGEQLQQLIMLASELPGRAAAIKNGSDASFWDLDGEDEGYDDYDYLYRHSHWMTAVYCVAYIAVFLVGLVGNSFVIAVVLRAPRMRTVTNFFIVNLAIADILVIVFCLPATLMSNIFVPWMLGWLMCKTVPYIQGVSVAASVYSLIAVSLDRFIAIWWPLKQMTKSRARFMIICIWVIAMASTIPWALFFDLVAYPSGPPDMYLCQEVWPAGTNGNLYFLLAHLVACYLLPMTLITLCYVLIWIKVSTRSIPGDSKDTQMIAQKSKIKVIKMLVAVVILFVLSWLPLYVIFTRIKFGGEISPEESEILNKVTPFAQWLGSSNSCINPILYAFFNKKYRRGFGAIIKSRSCCGRLRYYDNVAIASSTTSTRKSSHYHNASSRKSPSSPGLRKTNAVSYIYEHNTLRRHNLMVKQDSNLSQQMLLKQDSHGSRQYLIKQESASSDGSRRPLCQQDSSGSKMSLSKQDSVVSYMERRAGGHILCAQDSLTQDSISVESRRVGNCSPTANTAQRPKFVKQDSVISFVDQRPEPRRHQLVKQDSVISFADQRRGGPLNKQDSLPSGHHVSILKKTDSQLSGAMSSPRRNIEILE